MKQARRYRKVLSLIMLCAFVAVAATGCGAKDSYYGTDYKYSYE